jgi:rhodanese-related sulfurtransferase
MALVKEITVSDLKKMLGTTKSEAKDAPILVDVREPGEVSYCCIPGCINIPLGLLSDNLDRLPSDKQLVMICHHGVRSKQAAILLSHCGFNNVASLTGGVDSWAQEIDPLMKRY